MKTKSVIVGAVLAAFAIAGAIEWRAALRLRGEITALRGQVAERDRLRSEQKRLKAAQVSEVEWEKLRAESEAVHLLRGELSRLRQQVEARAAAIVAGSPGTKKEHEPTMNEEFVPCAAWKNAGQATPADAMQTALWAAAGGDLKTLAAAILLDPAAREKARRLLERLPQEVSAQFPTAEDFLALLMTSDVPLAEAHLIDAKGTLPEGMAVCLAQFRDETGKTRDATIQLRRVADKEWRLIVPETAVEKYAALFSGGAKAGGTQ